MIILIMMIVVIYSSLTVWTLAKLGSIPAKYVLEVFKIQQIKTQSQQKKNYEQTFSAE
ncbi:hypothetical protein Q7A53_03085 [Halobacillus rhizosphaerae]|uniref:hypothetical protein n=1 Tax=Halobacillus rhizosphaerae TaxID=3064889 RepID=UPI00398A8444